jgi:predicted nucleic acid-binding protein
MNTSIYLDTSALAKWYINEKGSEEVEEYIQNHGPMDISDLTVVEMRSLLSRHRQNKSINSRQEIKIFAAFQEDIRYKFLICHPFPAGLAAGTVNVLSLLSDIPLRTLDALHLTMAREIGADCLATADAVMAKGAEAPGMPVVRF